jgi:hypothetical protein
MATPPTAQLQIQLDRLKATGFADMLAQSAQANNLPKTFFYAIASRETNCKNILGDVQADGAHGVGIVQIDIQHPIAKLARDSGSWSTTPAPLVEFGAKLLAVDIDQVKHNLPNLQGNDILKVAASGYNCGITRAIERQASPLETSTSSPRAGLRKGRHRLNGHLRPATRVISGMKT